MKRCTVFWDSLYKCFHNELLTSLFQREDNLDEESLKELQKNGKDVSTVRNMMCSNSNETSAISTASSPVKTRWSQKQNAIIENNILYRN